MSRLSTSRRAVPIWGILSVALTPLAALLAILAGVIVELLVVKPEGMSMHSYITVTTRVVVLGTLAIILTGVVSAFVALVKRERPRWLPVLGLALTLCLIGLFHYTAVGPNGD